MKHSDLKITDEDDNELLLSQSVTLKTIIRHKHISTKQDCRKNIG